MITEPNQNSRMKNAEMGTEPGKGLLQAPSAPVQGGAPAPQPQGAPPPGPDVADGGIQGTGAGGNGQFVSMVADMLVGDEMWEANLGAIKQGPEAAADVAVNIGGSAFDQATQSGQPPSEDEQAAALELVIDDVVDIGMGEGVLPQDREKAQYMVGQLALKKWEQRYGLPEGQIAQEIAAGADEQTMQSAQSMENSFAQG